MVGSLRKFEPIAWWIYSATQATICNTVLFLLRCPIRIHTWLGGHWFRHVYQVALIFSLLTGVNCWGQITNVTNDQATPMPGVGHDYIGILDEIVSPSNGSLSIRISVPTPPGRGVNLPFQFSYNSNGVIQVSGLVTSLIVTSNMDRRFAEQGGWSYGIPVLSYQTLNFPSQNPSHPEGQCSVASGFVFTDPAGSRHAVGLSMFDRTACNAVDVTAIAPYYQGGDVFYAASAPNGAINPSATPFSVWDKGGTLFHFQLASLAGSVPDFIEDRNGNKINISSPSSSNGFPLSITDTAGRQTLSISSFGATGGDTVSVSGLSNLYTVTWGSTSYNFTIPATAAPWNSANCGGPSSPHTSGSMPVITSIGLPNGKSYQFQYDPVSGLLSKIIYPTGAYVSYVWGPSTTPSDPAYYEDGYYDANACTAKYNAYSVLQRTVYDGVSTTQKQTFSYSTSWSATAATPPWTSKQTTVTTQDLVTGTPSFNTNYSYLPFHIFPQPNYISQVADYVPLEQSIAYQGPTGNVLRTAAKSWVPYYSDLLQSETTTLENGQASQVSYSYSGWDNITEKDETDYGTTAPGALLRKTLITYAPFPATPFAIYLSDRPCKVVVQDGSGNPMAETDTLYDGGTTVCGTAGAPSVTAISGLPSGTHDETNYGASATTARGNATSVTRKCWPGCTDSNISYTYDETGQYRQRRIRRAIRLFIRMEIVRLEETLLAIRTPI